MWFRDALRFQTNISPPITQSKGRQSKKPVEAGSKFSCTSLLNLQVYCFSYSLDFKIVVIHLSKASGSPYTSCQHNLDYHTLQECVITSSHFHETMLIQNSFLKCIICTALILNVLTQMRVCRVVLVVNFLSLFISFHWSMLIQSLTIQKSKYYIRLRGPYSASELYRLSDRHLSTKFSANFCG
jgi:hypothetical protein